MKKQAATNKSGEIGRWRYSRSAMLLRMAALPVVVISLFMMMFLIGGTALRTQQGAMRAVVETDLESTARLARINSRLQTANTEIYRLMTQAAAEGSSPALVLAVKGVARKIGDIVSDLQDYRGSEAALLQRATLGRFINDLKDYEVAIDWIGSTLEIDFKSSIAFIGPYNSHVELLSQQLSDIIADTTTTAKQRADQATEALRQVVYTFSAAAAGVSILVAFFGYYSGKRHEMLSLAAQQKSQQVARLLDNSGQGFLSFGPNLVVGEDFSRACVTFFEEAPSGRAVDALLFPTEEARALMRGCVADALAATDPQRQAMFLSLIPTEVPVHGRILETEFIPIETGIMVVLSDVTGERALAGRVARESLRKDMIVAALTDGADFFFSVDEFRAFAAGGAEAWQDKDRLYRTIHTFKGTFSQFGFHHLPVRLHEAEALLQARHGQSGGDAASEVFTVDWGNILDQDLRTLIEALGADFVARGGVVTLSRDQVQRFEHLAEGLLISGHPLAEQERAVLAELANIRSISLSHALGEFDQMIQRIAIRLEKEVAPLVMEGDDILVDPDSFGPFLHSLGHVFRNAVDHGIEAPDARLAAGKSEMGRISCRFSRTRQGLALEIADDGAGIDEAGLRRHAARPGAEDSAGWSLSDLVFADGLSSREKATDLSGRGVGMAAVRSEVLKLAGDIQVTTRAGKGTSFLFKIPFAEAQGTRA